MKQVGILFNINLLKKKLKTNLIEGGSKSPLSQSKIFVGQMGSGKTVACCMEAARLMLSTNCLCITYDPLKGAKDANGYLSSPQFLNVSSMSEKDFLDCCEGWIAGAELAESKSQLNLSKLLGNGPRQSLIYIEEFNAIKDTLRLNELIREGLNKRINFYLASQFVLPGSLDLSLVNPYVFKVRDSVSNYLLGNNSASCLTTDDRGKAINRELNTLEHFKYIESIEFKNELSKLEISEPLINDMKFSFK